MVQKRRSVSAAMPIPNWGMSRSRKVRIKFSRHCRLAESDTARYDLGKPPLIHSCWRLEDPISHSVNPARSTNPILPANDSETPLIKTGDADPRSRNCAFCPGRSARTRSSSNSSGLRCASSMITRPVRVPSARRGTDRRRRSTGFSKSNTVDGTCSAIAWAKVVLPHCRGPSRAVMGCTSNDCSIRWRVRVWESCGHE